MAVPIWALQNNDLCHLTLDRLFENMFVLEILAEFQKKEEKDSYCKVVEKLEPM